jgi:nucleoside-diphosphate-sugar epimerase
MLRVNFSLQHFYGPGEGPDRFLGRIVEGLARRVPELEFTAGEQQRDFIHVGDVVGAFETVLANISSLGAGCHDFEVGFGQAVRLRDLIELVKRLCQNTETQLLFGAIPYRPNEVMYSVASCEALHRLGWKPIVDLETGLLQVISAEKKARIAA